MTNIALKSIDQYLDVASVNAYHTFHLRESVEKRLHRIHVSSRDSARTPVQWTPGKNAGFSEAEPWFYVNDNYPEVNVETEEQDPDSILHFYRSCLRLRRENETLLWGKYTEFFPRSRKVYMYGRSWRGRRVLVICSFHDRTVRCRLPRGWGLRGAQLLLCNDAAGGQKGILRPYEAQVWEIPNKRG